MPRQRIITLQGIPGANVGEAFTASIANRVIVPGPNEAFWESLSVSIEGTVAVGAVNLETFLGLLNPLTIIENEPRINMRGRDIFALSSAWYGNTPYFFEGTLAQVRDKALSMRIPLWVKLKNELYAWQATRVAQTNISVENISVNMLVASKVPANAPTPTTPSHVYFDGGRIDAREIPFTTPGATGVQQILPKLPKLGKLLGLLMFSNTVAIGPTNETGSFNSVFLDSTSRILSANIADTQAASPFGVDMTRANATEMVKHNILRNYSWFDFRDDPIDLTTQDVAVSVDVETTADPCRMVPVISVAQ